MLMRAFQNQNADLKRGLGLLLLIFIVYGTTVEAAHRHGAWRSTCVRSRRLDERCGSPVTAATTAALSDSTPQGVQSPPVRGDAGRQTLSVPRSRPASNDDPLDGRRQLAVAASALTTLVASILGRQPIRRSN